MNPWGCAWEVVLQLILMVREDYQPHVVDVCMMNPEGLYMALVQARLLGQDGEVFFFGYRLIRRGNRSLP